jgi:hypothetical protein
MELAQACFDFLPTAPRSTWPAGPKSTSSPTDAEVTQGYRLFSDAVELKLSELGMTSPGDVVIVGEGLLLTAGAMELQGPDGEAVVSFTGGVRVLYEAGD